MSFARFGFDSDVYVFGGTREQNNYIECCGCVLYSDLRKAETEEEKSKVADISLGDLQGVDMEWDWGPIQSFTSKKAILSHLQEHIDAGHKVPDDCIEGVRVTDWIPD